MLSRMVIDPSLLSADKIRPLSRLEYERMVELGFFYEDEHIELLEGVLVKMSPQGWQHAAVIQRISNVLARSIDDELAVRTQLPFAATDYSEPEPDIAVVHDDRVSRTHPREALLVVEVSGDSLGRDRDAKLAAYARAHVPEYWIVNVETMTVEVYTKPARARYARTQVLRDGDVLRPILLPAIEIAVADLPR
jgi:Uma2 family endonuclease